MFKMKDVVEAELRSNTAVTDFKFCHGGKHEVAVISLVGDHVVKFSYSRAPRGEGPLAKAIRASLRRRIRVAVGP